jgi:hypothetical protein
VWDLKRCSSWSIKDCVLGYVSPSNHLYRPHVADGIDNPSNYSRSIYPWNRQEDGRWSGMSGTLTRISVEPSMWHSGRFRESLVDVRQPLPLTREVWRFVPFFHVDIVVHLYRVFESLKSFEMDPSVVPTFYTHGRVVNNMMSLIQYLG